MPREKLSELVNRFGPDPVDETQSTDGELLARFAVSRDEGAFAELVRRYGPLVFAVCKRVTGDGHLAEDAFQAVFVVLAAKVASIRPKALPAWLHSVATRTALRARTVAHRRQRRETTVKTLPDAASCEEHSAEGADLAAVVDEEVARLPEPLRVAVVLCELEGCSRKEAAVRLGVPEGTVSSRLAAARKTLAARLQKRGIALSAVVLSVALGRHATASVPPGLIASALGSAMSPGVVPAAVAALSLGVLRVMLAQKLKVVLPLTALTLGAIVCAALAATTPPEPPVKPPAALPVIALAPTSIANPAPKAEPKGSLKGPNKLLIIRDNKLTLIDPDGKKETRLENKDGRLHPSAGRISPDGTAIALLVPAPIPPNGGAPGIQKAQASLHVRKVDEKEPGDDLGVSCQMFTWSPDGTEIACTECEDGPGQKAPLTTHFVINVKTKTKTSVKLPNNHFITDWSRDGKFFLTTAFNETDADPSAQLYLMKRDGTEHKALTDKKQNAVLGRISPDGKRVLFCAVTLPPKDKPGLPKRALAIVDVETSKITNVEDVPLNAELQQSYCWSPDGKKIAYTWREIHEGKPEDVINKETESHLIICDPDGKNAKTIATEKGKGQWHITISGVDWR